MMALITTTSIVLAVSVFVGQYDAEVIKVKDGDTIRMVVRLWPGVESTTNIRVIGIDTPESGWRAKSDCEAEESASATAFTENFLHDKFITLTNIKFGKYAGRILAEVKANGEDLGSALMEHGHAVKYTGGKKQPWVCTNAP